MIVMPVEEIIKRYGGLCPSCKRTLGFDVSLLRVAPDPETAGYAGASLQAGAKQAAYDSSRILKELKDLLGRARKDKG